MKKIFIISFLFIFIIKVYTIQHNKSYLQIYGEGPRGQHIYGFKSKTYSKEDAVNYAKSDIMEYLSGMLYGYKFVYKVENNLNRSKGFFELIPLAELEFNSKYIKLTQLEENDLFIKLQALYRLNEDQISYIEGFKSSYAKMSEGEAQGEISKGWDERKIIFKNAIRNSVLNEARKRLKSRPLYLKGSLLLAETPDFNIISGMWIAKVKVYIRIEDIKYIESY